MRCSRVLVRVRQCLHIYFWLSITFPSFSFVRFQTHWSNFANFATCGVNEIRINEQSAKGWWVMVTLAPTSLCSALTAICPRPHQDTFVAMAPRNWWSHSIPIGVSMYTAVSLASTRRTEVFEKNGPRNRIKTGFSAQECGKHGPEQPFGWLANDRTESIKEGTSKVIAVI